MNASYQNDCIKLIYGINMTKSPQDYLIYNLYRNNFETSTTVSSIVCFSFLLSFFGWKQTIQLIQRQWPKPYIDSKGNSQSKFTSSKRKYDNNSMKENMKTVRSSEYIKSKINATVLHLSYIKRHKCIDFSSLSPHFIKHSSQKNIN